MEIVQQLMEALQQAGTAEAFREAGELEVLKRKMLLTPEDVARITPACDRQG